MGNKFEQFARVNVDDRRLSLYARRLRLRVKRYLMVSSSSITTIYLYYLYNRTILYILPFGSSLQGIIYYSDRCLEVRTPARVRSAYQRFPRFHMSKRGGESIHGGKPIVKKRKGVKIRSTLIPDSDEDDAPSSVNAEYIRWVKTRVTTSGQVGSITTSSVAFMDPEGTTNDPPLEANTDDSPLEVSSEQTQDIGLQGAATKIRGDQRKQRKKNDSVSFPPYLHPSTLLKAIKTKMQSWLDVRPIVLDEMIRLDGPGDAQADFCSSCLTHTTSPVYRCLECSYGLLFCRECVIKSHRTMPLHRLEVCSFRTSAHLFSSHTIHSAGETGFLTENPYIPSGSFVILAMEGPPVPSTHPIKISLSSIPMDGTNCGSYSVPVG